MELTRPSTSTLLASSPLFRQINFLLTLLSSSSYIRIRIRMHMRIDIGISIVIEVRNLPYLIRSSLTELN